MSKESTAAGSGGRGSQNLYAGWLAALWGTRNFNDRRPARIKKLPQTTLTTATTGGKHMPAALLKCTLLDQLIYISAQSVAKKKKSRRRGGNGRGKSLHSNRNKNKDSDGRGMPHLRGRQWPLTWTPNADDWPGGLAWLLLSGLLPFPLFFRHRQLDRNDHSV